MAKIDDIDFVEDENCNGKDESKGEVRILPVDKENVDNERILPVDKENVDNERILPEIIVQKEKTLEEQIAELEPKLIENHRRLIEEYLIDGNGSKAAIRAGYSPKSAICQASEILSRPNNSKYLALKRQQLSEKLKITREDIVMELLQIKNSTKESNPKIAVQCLTQISKILGLYAAEKISYEGNAPVFIQLNLDNSKNINENE